MRQNDETDLAYCEPLADCERRNGELCKLWRKQHLRLSITIKALRQAFTVCQRAWLADCECGPSPSLRVQRSSRRRPLHAERSLRTAASLRAGIFPGWQSKSAIARLNR